MNDTPAHQTSLEKDLYLGLLENEAEKVIKALRDGADANKIYKHGKTHLMIALEHNCNKTIITQLLDVTDVNALDERKKSALMYALENFYDTDIISLLIDKGANVNAHDLESRTPYDYYLISSGCGLEVKRTLFRAGAYINDNLQEAEIHLLKAIERNDIKAVNEFISNGCNIDAVNNVGRSPLIYSLIHDINKEIAIQLIKHGAEVNITDQHYLTPLLYAIKYNRHKDIITNLIHNGADINFRDKKGRTPLIYSIKYKCSKDITEILINIGADVNLQNNLFKKSPLDYALQNKYPCDIILQLIKAGSDVNKCDDSGQTPLMYVMNCYEHHGIYQRNLLAGLDYYGYLSIPQSGGNVHVTEESRNSQNTGTYHNIDWQRENINNMLRYGADINKVDAKGNTILHYDSPIQLVKLFLKHGTAIDAKNNEGKTPLMTAVIFNNYKRVKALLLSGANPNSFDKNFDTPLHFARNLDIVNILIHFGADMNARNNNNFTPLLLVFVQYNMFHYVKLAHTTNTLLFNDSKRIEFYVNKCFGSYSRYNSCVEELTKMKSTYIKDDLTFYEFCTLKKSKRKRFTDLSKSQYLHNYELCQRLFPNFYSIIKLKIDFNEIEKRRHDLIRDIYKIMIKPITTDNQFESYRLNYDCLDTICDNLSYMEVHNLFLAAVD